MVTGPSVVVRGSGCRSGHVGALHRADFDHDERGAGVQPVFDAETVIAAPRTAVWAALTDWSRAPEWMDGVEELAADGPVAPGTVLTFTANGRARRSSILDVAPSEALTIRSELRGVVADYAYALEDDPEGTRVSLVATCATTGLQRLFGPVLRDAMRRTDSSQLEALRTVVEGG